MSFHIFFKIPAKSKGRSLFCGIAHRWGGERYFVVIKFERPTMNGQGMKSYEASDDTYETGIE